VLRLLCVYWRLASCSMSRLKGLAPCSMPPVDNVCRKHLLCMVCVRWWPQLQVVNSCTYLSHVIQASSTNGAGSSAQLRLVATVTQAGSYALSVAVTDPATKAVRRIPARGSPDTVMVTSWY
jgi:hypothetical protein